MNERIANTPLSIDAHGSSVRVVVAADKYTVATISERMNDREEYGRLFAAAPEMLKALKDLRAEIEMISGFWTEGLDNFAMQADAAIAKAEGGAP